MSNEIATRETPSLPDLYGRTHSANDIQPSGVYLIAELSGMARSGVAKPGDVVLATGSDDTDPTFLIGGDEGSDTFTAYIIGRDPFVASTADDSITFLPKDYVRTPEERDVWNGYFYYLTLKEDPMLPARLMLWRTAGMPVAKKLNNYLARAIATERREPVHVEFSVVGKHSQRGKPYWALSVKEIPADDSVEDALRQQTQVAQFLSANFGERAEIADSDSPAY